MTRSGRFALPAAAGALLLAGVVLAFQWHPSLPATNWLTANPVAAVALALATGFADGLNPCAIATLLLFVGALLALSATTAWNGQAGLARKRIWLPALAFITGVFVLYFTLGAGFIEVSQLRLFGNTHLFSRLAGLLAVPLGLVLLAEGVLPNSPLKLTMPSALHGVARRWGRRTTVGGALIGGVLIGLCTIPCGGALYLAVAAVIAGLGSKAYGYALLTTYNLAFVMPLILIVVLAGSRETLNKLSRMHVSHRRQVKLALGLLVVSVGFFSLL